MADKNENTEVDLDKLFASAFDEAAKPEPAPAAAAPVAKAEDPPAGDPAPKKEEAAAEGDKAAEGTDDKSGDEGTDDKPAEGAEKKSDDEGGEGEKPPAKADDKPAAKPAPKAEEQGGDDVLERLRGLLEQTPAKKEEPAPKVEEPQIFSEEEQKFLSDYDKEWPDVAKAEALKRRGEYTQLVGHIFREVHKQYAPLLQMVETLAAKAQYSELKETVPDYNDDEVDKIQAWVKEQPDYLQDAYNSVITSGTPKQVADLISRYRTATGTAGQQPQGGKPAPVPPKKKEQELPASAKQAAASLAPVGSKRSAVVSGTVDPEDFSGAFDTFAKQA